MMWTFKTKNNDYLLCACSRHCALLSLSPQRLTCGRKLFLYTHIGKKSGLFSHYGRKGGGGGTEAEGGRGGGEGGGGGTAAVVVVATSTEAMMHQYTNSFLQVGVLLKFECLFLTLLLSHDSYCTGRNSLSYGMEQSQSFHKQLQLLMFYGDILVGSYHSVVASTLIVSSKVM